MKFVRRWSLHVELCEDDTILYFSDAWPHAYSAEVWYYEGSPGILSQSTRIVLPKNWIAV
jgi:hypothetical protein